MWTDELRSRIDTGAYRIDYNKLQRYYKSADENLETLNTQESAASYKTMADILIKINIINDFLSSIEVDND